MPNEVANLIDPVYELEFEDGCYILDEAYNEHKDEYVIVEPGENGEPDIGIIVDFKTKRPKGTKVTMKKRGATTVIVLPPNELKMSKITVNKIVKKNSDNNDDHWDYDYNFAFEMHWASDYNLEDFTITLKYKQNNKEYQFNVPILRYYKEEKIIIDLHNQDTALFDITETVIGENLFNIVVGDNYFSFDDVPTDFTVDLSELNLIQKGRYAVQRIKVKD